MFERAVILAGGQGTRLRPYTLVLPKPLMPIGEYPILEVIIRQLAAAGVRRITLAVSHQAKLIQTFFGNGESWGVEIDYSAESRPLSTIAPLRLIPDLPERFLLMNGDVLTSLRFADLFRHHMDTHGLFTIAAAKRRHTIDYGVLRADDQGRLVGFLEKPSEEYLVSIGVYAVERVVLSIVPAGRPYGFDHLMADLLQRGSPVHVYPFDGYWLDIGRPDDYARAVEEFERLKPTLLPHA
jgi:NDP-sugar pyrophosphorylase family protein